MANLFFRTSVAPYRIDTYNALHDKLGFELYFLYREDSSQNFNMQAMYDQCHFQAHFLKTFSFIKKHFKVCTEIGRIIKENNPNIVIVPEFKILTLQVLLHKYLHRSKFRVVSMCDDSYDMVSNDNDFSKAHKWARSFFVPKLDDLLLVDSKVVDWYQKHFGKGVWLPIIRDDKEELPAYERVLPISEKYREQFELSDQKVLLFVGRLVPLKNIDRVIRAINACKEDFTFVVVGDGPEFGNWKAEAKTCNHRVVFAGRYEGDDVRAWYNVADAFILASWQEAYGAVTNEALLAGCKCVVSSHCGSACLIDENNGVIIDPYNEIEIAEKIDAVMATIERKKDLVARKNLMRFTFEDTINRISYDLI